MKTKKQQKAQSKGLKLQEYLDSLDLYDWWEKFNGEWTDNGQHKYITINQFIKSRTKDKHKHEFLWWILGPSSEEPRNPAFKTFKQYDWEHKRGQGFWLTNPKVQEITQNAASRMSSIDEVKAIGSHNLGDMEHIRQLMDQLDNEYAGRLQLPNLSMKENDMRLNNYFRLREKLQQMMHAAQAMFAKTRSVDFSALAEMMTVIGPAMIGQLGTGTTVSVEDQKKLDSWNSMNEMIMRKAAQQNLPLPDPDMESMVKKSSPVVIDRKAQKVN